MQLHGLWRWFKQNVAAGMGWVATSTAMSVVLVVTALAILSVMVRDVGIGKVIAAMVATPPQATFAAFCLVCVSYFTLTLYDCFALRTLGRHEVPYATAGLAGFAAYAIEHGLGMTLVTGTGNAVRLRIYSRCGLTAVEVVKIAFRRRWLRQRVATTLLGASAAMGGNLVSHKGKEPNVRSQASIDGSEGARWSSSPDPRRSRTAAQSVQTGDRPDA